MIEDLELRLKGFDVGEKQVAALNKALDVLDKVATKADAKLQGTEKATDKVAKAAKKGEAEVGGLAKVMQQLTQRAEAAGQSLGVGAVGGKIGLAAGMAAIGVAAGKAVYNFAEAGAKAKDAERAFYGLGGTTTQLATAMQNLGGTVSEDYLRRQFNLAKTLGISSDQFAQLTKVAKVAASALGKDVGEALNDVTVAVARQSKLILDNIGITFDIEDANKKYAASIGKTASQLSEAEKQQAFFNATIAGAQPLLDKISTDAAADKYARLAAAIANAQEVAAGFADWMVTNSSVGAFGGYSAGGLAGSPELADAIQNTKFERDRRNAIAHTQAEQAGYGDIVRGGLGSLQRWARSGTPMGPANGTPEQIAARDEAEARARARGGRGRGRGRDGFLDEVVREGDTYLGSVAEEEARRQRVESERYRLQADEIEARNAARGQYRSRRTADRDAAVGAARQADYDKGRGLAGQGGGWGAMFAQGDDQIAGANAALKETLNTTSIIADGLDGMTTGFAEAAAGALIFGTSFGKALEGAFKQIAFFNAVKAIEQTALGLGALASFNIPSATLHFKAAATHALVGAVAYGVGAVAGAASGGGGGGGGARDSNAGSYGGNGSARGPRLANSDGGGTTHVTVIVGMSEGEIHDAVARVSGRRQSSRGQPAVVVRR